MAVTWIGQLDITHLPTGHPVIQNQIDILHELQ